MAQVTHSQKGLFMATTPKLLTYEEWLKLPEAEGIEEVVNGEIRKMPPNKWNQARVVEQLALLLRAQVDPQRIFVVTTVFGLVIRQEPVNHASAGLGRILRKPDCRARRLHSFGARVDSGSSFASKRARSELIS